MFYSNGFLLGMIAILLCLFAAEIILADAIAVLALRGPADSSLV